MLEKNTVIITTEEYKELLKCKLLILNIFDNCFASKYGEREEVYFPVDKALQETLFPKETEQAKRRAIQELNEKESGDKQ